MTWREGDLAMVAKPYQAIGPDASGVDAEPVELLHERVYVAGVRANGVVIGRIDAQAGTKAGGKYGLFHLPGAILKTDPTPYGFQWGPVEVIRMAEHHVDNPGGRHWRVVQIETDAGVAIQVYVSGTGRSVRVYRQRKGKRPIELTPGPEPT